MTIEELVAEMERLGPYAHLATVTPGGNPHVVPIHVDWCDDALYAMVGRRDTKIRNLAANPAVCLHYQVSEAANWDSLMIWGEARILDSLEDKRRLWEGVLSYDLNAFSPGGPDNSPNSVFLKVTPSRGLVLRQFGMQGREVWESS